jgi:hypothetical protein
MEYVTIQLCKKYRRKWRKNLDQIKYFWHILKFFILALNILLTIFRLLKDLFMN